MAAAKEGSSVLTDQAYKHLENEEFREGKAVADKALKEEPGNTAAALKCKVFCLMSLGEWAQTIKLLRDLKQSSADTAKLAQEFSFELSYSLYKQNKLSEAFEVLSAREAVPTAGPEEDKYFHLGAQIYYRLGQYDKSMEALAALGDPQMPTDLKDAEGDIVFLRVNKAAVRAAAMGCGSPPLADEMRWLKKVADDAENVGSHDLAFNLACMAVSRGRWREADQLIAAGEEKLRIEIAAEEKCAASSIPVTHPEVAGFTVQKAVALQRRGEASQASALYNDFLAVDSCKKVDGTTLAVSRSNYDMAIDSHGLTTVDQINRIPFITKSPFDRKLTRLQSTIFFANKVLAIANSGDLSRARSTYASSKALFAGCPLLGGYVLAAVEQRAGSARKAVACLAASLKNGADRALPWELPNSPLAHEMVLALTKTATRNGMADDAAQALKGVQPESLLHSMSACRAVVQLFHAASDLEAVQRIAETVAARMAEESNGDGNAREELKMAAEVLRVGAKAACLAARYDVAYRLYECAHKEASGGDEADSIASLAGLVETAQMLPATKEHRNNFSRLLNALQGPAGLRMLDPEDLETAVAPVARPADELVKAAEAGASKKSVNKKRKPRYPKNFDPSNPGPLPDKERWLPKHSRVAYLKLMKKKGVISKGPQGALPGSDATFRSQGPSTAHAEAAVDASTRRRRR